MKHTIIIFALLCFFVSSNALTIKTLNDKTITGTIVSNESERLEVSDGKHSIFIRKDQILNIMDDNGNDVTDKYTINGIFNMRTGKKIITRDSVKTIDISSLNDREFQLYLNDLNTTQSRKTRYNMWYVAGFNLVAWTIGGFIYYNNAVRHPPKQRVIIENN
ncbi:MAG TPA: hypothetical protein PLE74_07075 [Candidatus Cloacimonadota bacterium]|nr:hypothetical protein [Candidatus Cloacimonadota bacterium]HPT72027.1 hypothetical protein [Candidatus Cloacimonadota bacterium]